MVCGVLWWFVVFSATQYKLAFTNQLLHKHKYIEIIIFYLAIYEMYAFCSNVIVY